VSDPPFCLHDELRRGAIDAALRIVIEVASSKTGQPLGKIAQAAATRLDLELAPSMVSPTTHAALIEGSTEMLAALHRLADDR
jgi:hypothetical protein